MADHSQMRLGLRTPRFDPRTPRLRDYLTLGQPTAPAWTPPPDRDWLSAVATYPMYANDRLGCCGPAMAGHLVQILTAAATGTPVTVTEADVLAFYSLVGGYDPAQQQPDGSNPTDNGVVLLDLMNAWKQTGIGGHQIAAFAYVDPTDDEEWQACVDIFGGVACGFSLPTSAQTQDEWDVAPPPDGTAGSWGGHAIPIGLYAPDREECVTWAARKRLTQAFRRGYCDQAFAVVTQDFVDSAGMSPGRLNLQQLLADVAAIPPLPGGST